MPLKNITRIWKDPVESNNNELIIQSLVGAISCFAGTVYQAWRLDFVLADWQWGMFIITPLVGAALMPMILEFLRKCREVK